LYSHLIDRVDGFRTFIGAPAGERFNLVLLGGKGLWVALVTVVSAESVWLSSPHRSAGLLVFSAPVSGLSHYWGVI